MSFVGEDPTPEPESILVAVGRRHECHGLGTESATVSMGPMSWAYANVTCEACHGSGEAAPVPATA